MNLHNDGAPPRAHTYPVPTIRALDDSERNQLAELRHEACENHCDECGRCDWEPTGPTSTRTIPMVEHEASVYCPDCIPNTWKPEPDPANGYNPGPELAVTHDGVTLTVQRTHLHPERADYHWQILTEGTVIPLIDGVLHCHPTLVLRDVAAHLAWHWYATEPATKIMVSPLEIWPATTRTPDPDVCAALRIIHAEALT